MMRDEEKFKERYQLLLDNRQIFLLFFASAVILALVFSLGVVVGRRLDTGPAPPPPSDPLALLDRMSKEEAADDNLTFHEELSDDKPAAAAPAAADAGNMDGPAVLRVPRGAGQDRKPVPSPAAAARPKAEPAPPAAPAKAEPAKPPPPPPGPPPGSMGKFTLQLSSFQDRQEAAQFIEKLRQEGLKPFMIAAKIPGRGVWYRVRVGSYSSWEEALAAKQNFEKKHKVIAYVAKH